MNGQPWLFRLVVDSAAAGVGVLMLLNETFVEQEPRWLVMMVALVVLGFIPAHNIGSILARK